MTRFTAVVTTITLSLLLVVGCAPESQITYSNTESQVNAHSQEHDYSVEIEGSEMKKLTISQIASMWEIDAQLLLGKIVTEFGLTHEYNTDSVLDDLRNENKFSPSLIKEIAENIKEGIAN